MLNAFCRVAPSLRFKARAIAGAVVFFFASFFKVLISTSLHDRRLPFFAILRPPYFEERRCIQHEQLCIASCIQPEKGMDPQKRSLCAPTILGKRRPSICLAKRSAHRAF